MSVTHCVKVIINNPSRQVDRCFDYIGNGASEGDHVLVPFGKGNKLTDGVVIGEGEAEYTDKLKTVERVKGKQSGFYSIWIDIASRSNVIKKRRL